MRPRRKFQIGIYSFKDLKVMLRESKAAESVEEGGKVYPIVTLHPIKEKEIQSEALPFSRKIL